MKLTSIQIVLIIFIIFAVTRVILRFRENVLSAKTAAFWLLIWLLAFIVIIHPITTTKLASLLGVGRGVDIIIYISLALLFYLVFRIYVMIEDLRREITSLVRHIALSAPKRRPKKLRK